MAFVSEHPQHPVELVLRVLGIASSTYYGWLRQAQAPSARRLADQELLAEIVDIYTSSGGTYGSPRVHAMLRRRGISVGRKRVERLMRGAGLQGAFLRKKWRLGSTRKGSACHSGAGPGQPGLHRRRAGSLVGG
ncbi:IS3 family transposase [Nocardia sp. NPDC003482]